MNRKTGFSVVALAAFLCFGPQAAHAWEEQKPQPNHNNTATAAAVALSNANAAALAVNNTRVDTRVNANGFGIGVGGNSTVTGGSQSTTVVTGNGYNDRLPAASAIAPSIMAGGNCVGRGISGAVQTGLFGVSLGGNDTDEVCRLLEVQHLDPAMKRIAFAVLCDSSSMKRAIRNAGYYCPGDEPNGQAIIVPNLGLSMPAQNVVVSAPMAQAAPPVWQKPDYCYTVAPVERPQYKAACHFN